MQPVTIGPLVFAGDRLAAIIGIGVFMGAAAILSSRLDPRLERWSTWALVAGLVGARVGHVAENAAGYAAEPWRILAVWQGGFFWPWGAVALSVVSAALVRSRRTAAGAVAALGLALFAWNVAWQLTSATSATPVPDIALARIDGGTATLAPIDGKPVVVNLWASWCPPCRREMPMMAQTAVTRDDVTFLFVNQGEALAAIETYLADQKLMLPKVLLDPHREVARHYAMPGLPATLFIGADGRLRSVHVGEISREALAAAIGRMPSE